MRKSFKGEVVFSEKEENSYFEYEIENSDAEGLLGDDIVLNSMREKDVLAKKAQILNEVPQDT